MTEERLSSGQRAVKELTDEMLRFKRPDSPLSFVDFRVDADAAELETRLRAALPDLMLPAGASLGIDGGDYYPDINLHVGTTPLVGVQLRVYGWEFDKHRIDPNGPDKPPYKVLSFPGEKDWSRQIEIGLWYSDGRQSAAQKVSVYAGSSNPGAVPSLSRDVVAPAYAETGYEGHNQAWREHPANRDVLAFVAIARDLFGRRVQAPRRAGLGE
jgi:hypothetical protein